MAKPNRSKRSERAERPTHSERSGRPSRPGRRTKKSNGTERAAGRSTGRAAGRATGRSQRSSRALARDTSQLYDLIEGRRACAEALDTGIPIAKALVLSGANSAASAADASLKELIDRLNAAGVSIEEVPRAILDSMSSHGAHQGIMLRTRPFQYADLSTIIQRASGKNELVVVLDHVTDEGNFGAIVRSAEVVGAAGIVIAKARAARVGTAAYKTSAGAVLHVPIAQVSNLASALDELKKAGFWVVGSTEHATQSVWESPMNGRLVLVMGSEGNGISQLVLKKCDFSCKLPQRGLVESLNVAQAATVMCYEWMRQATQNQVTLGEVHE